MIANLQEYFTFEIIYIWLNLGVIPFWIMLISIPDSKINQILINSIFIPLILALTYIYIINQIILSGNYMFDIFDLYLGLDNLYVIFSNEEYLLIFRQILKKIGQILKNLDKFANFRANLLIFGQIC